MNLIDADKLICQIECWDSMDDKNKYDFIEVLKEAPTANDWISVERELPENDERMLVVLINATHYKYKTIARHCGDNEWVDDNWDDVDGVIAWKPIEPYTGDKI